MRTIDRLRLEARAAATWRGHEMSHFKTLSPALKRSHCVKCGKEVDVTSSPAINEIDIGGPAVAINCPD